LSFCPPRACQTPLKNTAQPLTLWHAAKPLWRAAAKPLWRAAAKPLWRAAAYAPWHVANPPKNLRAVYMQLQKVLVSFVYFYRTPFTPSVRVTVSHFNGSLHKEGTFMKKQRKVPRGCVRGPVSGRVRGPSGVLSGVISGVLSGVRQGSCQGSVRGVIDG
jgi:hypothetical protein